MKENYEILLDCSPFESFEKCGTGLEEAIDRVEALLLDGTPSEQLQLIYVRQDATGEIVECYDVYDVTPLDMRGFDERTDWEEQRDESRERALFEDGGFDDPAYW